MASLDPTGITNVLTAAGNALAKYWDLAKQRLGLKNASNIQQNVEAQREQAAHQQNAEDVADELKEAQKDNNK